MIRVQLNKAPPPPERYPMSGIWLDHKPETIWLSARRPREPREQVGVRPGDRILGQQFGPLIVRLSGAANPAAPVPLSLLRGGERLEVVVKPAAYLHGRRPILTVRRRACTALYTLVINLSHKRAKRFHHGNDILSAHRTG